MILLCIIAVLIPATALVMSCRYIIGRLRHYRRSSHLARQRMQLLRRLLRLAYVYGPNPALFLKKFQEEVSIGHLECCDVICNYTEQRQLEAVRTNSQAVKNQDVLLCILINKGFTPQELSVMYGMTNYNSIYVRYSRIRKFCKKAKVEDMASLAKIP